MQSPRTITTLLLLILALTGCGKDIGPTSDQILSALNLELPAGLNATAASKETEENLGTEALPDVQARVSVTIELTEDFYENQGSIGGYGIPYKTLVQKVADKGTVLNGTVVTKSVPTGNSWDIDFQRYDVARVPGEPQSRFTLNSYVVNGSTEHEQLSAELEAARLVAEDEERQRQEQLALEREADRQRSEVEAAAALEQAKIFRQSISGTWESVSPVEWNGQVYSGFGATVNYRINIPAGDDLRGQADVTVFASGLPSNNQNLKREVTVKAAYTFEGGKEGFTLAEVPSNDRVADWNIDKTWTLTPDANDDTLMAAQGFYRGGQVSQRLRKASE